MPWIPCLNCGEFWCMVHNKHAFECPCPPIEEWTANPYEEPSMPHEPRPANTVGLRVEITKDDRDHLNVIAAQAGKSMAAYVRWLITEDIEKHSQPQIKGGKKK